VRATPPRLANVRILLVDDDDDTRELLSLVLRAEAAKYVCVRSGQEALRAIRSNPIDLLVTDISMPGMDGFELLAAVGSLPPEEGGRIPAIAMTAFGRDLARERSLGAGFDAFVAKPVAPDDFVDTILKRVSRPGASAT